MHLGVATISRSPSTAIEVNDDGTREAQKPLPSVAFQRQRMDPSKRSRATTLPQAPMNRMFPKLALESLMWTSSGESLPPMTSMEGDSETRRYPRVELECRCGSPSMQPFVRSFPS